jgi:hypothetical protein
VEETAVDAMACGVTSSFRGYKREETNVCIEFLHRKFEKFLHFQIKPGLKFLLS